MADVLARIVARKKEEVVERLGGRTIAAEPTTRSLRAALSRPGVRFIMEVKRASPSGHRSALTVEQAVAAYAPVADALSVLIDGPDFGGSLDDLRFARERFDGPILAKDFIVDPAQVDEARAAGADVVLVMMSVLEDEIAKAVMDRAAARSMDVIVEVHDEEELSRALALGATIVGINNRDLKTLRTDLAVTERLAPLVPADVLVISESGVGSRADVKRLAPFADAFLVGSSLMASPDIAQAARALVHGTVKLCGMTRADDVRSAAAAGATHVGMIFVPGTPRAVTPSEAAPLAAAATDAGLKPVGVFRDADPGEVADVATKLKLVAVQLHGSESEEAIADLRRRLPDHVEIWGVSGVDADVPAARSGVDRTLFDRQRGGASGGLGEVFNWSLVEGRDELSTAFIAGGLGPENIADADRLGAFGLDVGSGVEASPGVKNEGKVRALFAALRPKSRGDA
ncbi:bifunctional indole-3-glycerol-phosphate synthase TrpC/phosphoribosylanthranilate isomerase TrpF [Sphingomonas sp. LY29]|uniref:bifunctional indole-3-glycerol-phosphate synthase TrpC/phosphoribosylanthranilate isomerase TrpF n=1 Tax=Sphingomonas sp. LY29 TaxID=3095341 RepID=UPI002D794CF5|nr:bifunctional indole-3-glycerol-phosphate synthase TrpC/phosphoribosylanthranilate isomerase TrpF [Sphingomonas sp. LY29]WRP26817.1 bifunctional indole-3-glycerol-phosphate synthase TrpC/phosphoribosylanthranilate isomerase TrpF [Sphingomonas sp. LY29]